MWMLFKLVGHFFHVSKQSLFLWRFHKKSVTCLVNKLLNSSTVPQNYKEHLPFNKQFGERSWNNPWSDCIALHCIVFLSKYMSCPNNNTNLFIIIENLYLYFQINFVSHRIQTKPPVIFFSGFPSFHQSVFQSLDREKYINGVHSDLLSLGNIPKLTRF